ncbi:MAG TPA: hypothetical protein VGI82_07805 [Chitinophagaceae bacterium]
MKTLYFIVFFFLFPVALFCQTIHGIWTGTLANDSTHRKQNFELGLSEYRGKITGYSYTTFIDNDTLYYSIKRIKAERKDGNLVIEDEEMVANNFPEKAAKHVKQTTTFPLINDSTIDIADGRWSTNQTKRYYSISGSATVREQDDEQKSDLLAHLQEAKIKTDIAVDQKKKKTDNVIAKNLSIESSTTSLGTRNQKTDIATLSKQDKKDNETTNKISDSKQVDTGTIQKTSVARNDKAVNTSQANSIMNQPATKNDKGQATSNISTVDSSVTKEKNLANNNSNNPNLVNVKKDETTTLARPVAKKDSVVQGAQKTDQPLAKISDRKVNNSTVTNTNVNPTKNPVDGNKELPATVAGRKNEVMQDVFFKNDSLVLALYDNGIVDGDTVSVFLNGETIMSRQMLKSVATKKTIYISPKMDSVQLVLFAENLGTIPPNTGLLTVRDGEEVYQVHFTADLQNNASIILRRKKN